jgi:hypothetical protein
MTEASLKDWEFVKEKKYDLGSKVLDPTQYLFQHNNGIYYPVIRLSDIPHDSPLFKKYHKC